jgi:alpha-tubulin suppressor-like RCC1 family protein
MNRRTSPAAYSLAGTLSLAVLSGITLLAAFPMPSAGAPQAGGIAFAFGSNISGQTGLGANVDTSTIATPIDMMNLGGRSIKHVAAGSGHSLLLADDGTVFSFGANRDGQTGLGTNVDDTMIATQIDTRFLGGRSIKQVAAGLFHSLLLADDGTVFSFGWNAFGQTGLGTTQGRTLVATPIDTTNLGGRSITQVAAGGLHSLLLADDGTVFSFGFNGGGQTGLRTVNGNTLVAMPIDTTNLAGRSIKHVAAGLEHSLLLADDGTVFSFGWNRDGRSGLGTDVGVSTFARPIATTNLRSRSITQIAAGNSHSLLLSDDGTVYSFGSNSGGRTGLGTADGGTLVATPIDTTNLEGRSIKQVAAGVLHSLLLADDGTAFSFGCNGMGQTGLGTTDGNTLIATPIDTANLTGLRVIDISAGDRHSLLVAVPEPGSLPLLVFGTALLWLRRR